MNHRRARALLSDSLDGMLVPPLQQELRLHLAGCPACSRELRELRAAERLLGRLPASLLAQAWTPAGEVRLRALTRWAEEPEAVAVRWQVPALGALAAVALALLVWLNPLSLALAHAGGRSAPSALASRPPLAFLVVSADTPTPVPYTWRQ